ncbi:hypothetical protein [Okeania sp.]|uniref:hypothetical protein n=1 Tax=Okeania sp. TaxID=3100323 RepID=UPI002B4B1B40|nr:hypothetical protein [Okeania sp.]MEB3340934.1 hypothetical protein [Okeania sp.]
MIRNQGALFNSPLHFIGFSRGTVVNSEIIQRLGTFFPEAGGKVGTGQRDLQMTTLDPHDFDQPTISLPFLGAFSDFREPKVQVWDNVTFADNYYQTVPRVEFGIPPIPTATPAGRDIPNLLGPDALRTELRTGLNFPRNASGKLLGEPDLSVRLGTRRNTEGDEESKIGFTKDNLVGKPHQQVVSWYGGTTDLSKSEARLGEESQPIYRRRGDASEQKLFDKQFYERGLNPAFNPWYVPDHMGTYFSKDIETPLKLA